MGETVELLSDEELAAVVDQVDALIAEASALRYRAIREIDRRPGFVPGARAGTEAKTFLRGRRAANPAADVRAAHALADDLPQLAKALSVGEVNLGHVEVAVSTVRKIPRPRLDDGGAEKVDTVLTDAARELAPREMRKAADRVLAYLDPDGGDTLDPHELERRELVIWDEPNGWTGFKGRLDPANGASFRALIDRLSAPHPAHACGEDELPVQDRRSQRQRQADALGLATRLGLAAVPGASDVARPHVVFHVRNEGRTTESEHAGTISQAWMRRFLCDADIQRLTHGHGSELELGRRVRTATPAQRLALIARDQTCVVPGCTIPAAWADAHHLQWWSNGGLTNVSGMAMVCGPHHADVHAGVWVLELRDGVPWAKPPRWIDPEQRWRRNRYQHHHQAAEQLAIDLQPPDTG